MHQGQDVSDVQHGTTYGYRKGCRCEECRRAKREDWQRYKERQQTEEHQAIDPMEDFEGMAEPDQIGEMVKNLVLKVRCECGAWHEAGEDCPQGLD